MASHGGKGVEKLDISIRTATPDDAEELLAIYAQYVENTAVTFEYSVPSEAEFRRRIENTLKKYPYLVAVSQGEIVGYAYAGEFKAREAYAYSVEISVYVKQGLTRSGIGRELYTVLEKALKAQNIVNVNACITYPEIEDEYVSKNSKRFHEHMGYRFAGEFRKCGYKFGRWYNVAWMEKYINDHERKPQPVNTFREIAADIIE